MFDLSNDTIRIQIWSNLWYSLGIVFKVSYLFMYFHFLLIINFSLNFVFSFSFWEIDNKDRGIIFTLLSFICFHPVYVHVFNWNVTPLLLGGIIWVFFVAFYFARLELIARLQARRRRAAIRAINSRRAEWNVSEEYWKIHYGPIQ